MIYQFNFKKFARMYYLLSGGYILRGRIRVSAWVIVKKNYTRTFSCDCWTEDFSNSEYRTVYCSLVKELVRDNTIFIVQKQHTHFFMIQRLHFRPDQTYRVIHGSDGKLFITRWQRQ